MAARESIAELNKRAGWVSHALAKLYPTARISLDFETPWQCLAATILSAQSTDAGVNRVTPRLFKEYPDALADGRGEENRRGLRRRGSIRDGSAGENSGSRAQDCECDSRACLRQARLRRRYACAAADVPAGVHEKCRPRED